MQLWKWLTGLTVLGIGGYEYKTRVLDKAPQVGDVVQVSINNLHPVTPAGSTAAVIAAAQQAITTPLADGTIMVTLTAVASPPAPCTGTIRNVLGATLPVLVMPADMLHITRGTTVIK